MDISKKLDKENKLTEDFEYSGIKFTKGSEVILHNDGSVNTINFTEEIKYKGYTFVNGLGFHIFTDEPIINWGWFKEATEVDGIKYLGSPYQTIFHKNGKIQSGFLADDTEVQGIKIPKENSVSFYQDGKLQTIHVNFDMELKGKKYSMDDEIHFDRDGNIMISEEFDKYYQELPSDKT